MSIRLTRAAPLLAATCLLAPMPVSAQGSSAEAPAATTTKSKTVPAADREFLRKAARHGKAEVELGQLAADKGESAAVRKFGQTMVEHHSSANKELESLATDRGVQLPQAVGPQHRKLMQRLQQLSGAQFDNAYMRAMVNEHVKDVAEFERQSRGASDPEVRALAAKMLPTLREHLDMAREARAEIEPSATRTARSGQGKGTVAKSSGAAQR